MALKSLHSFAASAAILLSTAFACAQARVAAPAFTATDSHGQAQSLDKYKGKYVVLGWHNQGCPYTRKHYAFMQELQQAWTAKGVAWFTVISSAPGTQGYMTADRENAYVTQVHAAPTAVLLDPQGKLGRLYGARTTPQMFVIDPNGKLICEGAIDDRPTTDLEDVKGADNYVTDALTAAMAGKPVARPFTRSYGCSVKYAD